jgi:transketolase
MSSHFKVDLSDAELKSLRIMANRLRRHSLLSTTEAKSGHPSTCFSCAEIVASVFFRFLRYDLEHPKSPYNDRFVLSKGHAAPILWAALAEAGAFPVDRLLTLRRIDSDLEGHPTPRSPFVDVSTGSLGQGLSNAVGMALASKVDGIDNRVYALLGDGETAEGAVWEAAALAAHYRLGHLVAIVDVNRLGQSEPTMYQHNLEIYRRRFEAFGWQAEVVDGHDIPQVLAALRRAVEDPGTPSAILAKTVKGKGVSFMEDADGWHGKPVTDRTQLDRALSELGPDEPLPEPLVLAKPNATGGETAGSVAAVAPPNYNLGDAIATREAYGEGLAKLGRADRRVVALDGDCKNSTFAQTFLKEHPDRFFECFIAEQNMVGAAAGLASLGKIPFASSFACFLTRAYDFIRMASISQAGVKLCGSHAGVSIGEDGPSQMALEDLAMMRAVAGSTVLYPSDGVSAERLVALAAKTPGIVYLRTSRPKTPVIYSNDETFDVGGCKVLRSGTEDQATVVGAGVTVHEALKAYDLLMEQGIAVRVIDLYSVKPVDRNTLVKAAKETGRVITVEDHYAEGGLGEAVHSALVGIPGEFQRLAVDGLPRSGKSDELLDHFGISARRIAEAVVAMI